MKSLCFWIGASLGILGCYLSCTGQEQQPLRPDWLAQDYKSIELISQLASPAPLTVQAIRDILQLGDDHEEEDLGFGASIFEFRKGNGYTALNVEGFVFKGAIGFYKLGVGGDRENWHRMREHIIDLWKHNHGPAFIENENGLVHEETNAAVFLSYKSAVSAELGEMKRVALPDELKKPFDYLTSPIESRAIGGMDGDRAISALVNANRVDLIENALRGFSPSGRVYAALALLKLNKDNQMVLSADTIGTIAKVSNFNISIRKVGGCIVSYRTANESLSELDDMNHPEP